VPKKDAICDRITAYGRSSTLSIVSSLENKESPRKKEASLRGSSRSYTVR
jgi:hypothetical protein